jgi:tol-pal system protein YbgF
MTVRRAAVALLLLGSSQWCAAGLFSDDEAHRKITELEQQVQVLNTRLAAAENQVSTQSRGMLDLMSQIDALKAELSRLLGQNEVYAHDIQTTQKRQRDLYVDLDTRLRKLEQGAVPREPAPVPAPVAPPSSTDAPGSAPSLGAQPGQPMPVPALQASIPNPADESRAYEAALNLFKSGNYPGAISGFQGFASAYPASPLTPSAHYWIGNAHFNLRDYKSAIASQQKLIADYPASSKVPDALLNVASCQMGMGDAAAARRTLEELVAKHPLSNAADLAKKRLNNLR